MPERETNKLETAEQLGHEILNFVKGTELGTPQYEAVSDFLDLKSLRNSLNIEIRNSLSDDGNLERKRYWESQTRITEYKIALLEHQIDQRQSRIEGYQTAHVHIGINLEELGSIARKEAKVKFPEDERERNNYENRIYNSVVSKAEDIINGKRD